MEVFGFELSLTWILVLGVVLISVWYDWWCHHYFQRRGIPVATYIPLFGGLKYFRDGLQEGLTGIVKKHGNVVGYYDFRRPVLLINDPDILKNVLVKNFSIFPNRRKFPLIQPPLDRGLSLLVNEEWKEVRNVITPSFSASKMRRMAALINECSDTLVDSFSKAREGGQAVDCTEVFGGFTMDVTARCGFGLHVNSQQNKDDPFVRNAKKALDFNFQTLAVILMSVFPPLAPLLRALKYGISDAKATKFFMEVTEAAFKLRKEEGDNASQNIDLLQLMMNAHNDDEHDHKDTTSGKDKATGQRKRKALSAGDVMAQMFSFFVAGYETTNTLLSLTAYLLATNQDIQEKLHSEIDNLAPTRDNLGYDIINKMEYLDMVISESLRMYPPVVIFDRVCTETIHYDGLTIEAGINVFVSIWTLHYDQKYWANPTKFDPERFSAENKSSIKPCTYVPFGFGPRNCIAMRFALLEAKMALVRVLQQYRFDVCSETEIPPILGKKGFLSPKAVKLNAVQRN